MHVHQLMNVDTCQSPPCVQPSPLFLTPPSSPSPPLQHSPDLSLSLSLKSYSELVSPMADQTRQSEGSKGLLSEKGPTASQVIAVITLFPIADILFTLSGLTLTGTLIGLALATPVFLLFSPILVPAVIVIGLAVTGFLTSGAFGLTALSSLAWIAKYLRGVRASMPEHLEHAKRRVSEGAGYVEKRSKDLEQQGVQSKGQEAGRT